MKVSIKALRVNCGKTQKQAAEEIGVARETLISWETNRTFPSAIQLGGICKAYGCEIDDIFLPDMLTKS